MDSSVDLKATKATSSVPAEAEAKAQCGLESVEQAANAEPESKDSNDASADLKLNSHGLAVIATAAVFLSATSLNASAASASGAPPETAQPAYFLRSNGSGPSGRHSAV
ncbi:hypothetical protein CLOP_g10201 [Closterium sp. NIES-67]|nr:hypothetical protein CLOP_g10201 [Closterium sp. NIES-67]